MPHAAAALLLLALAPVATGQEYSLLRDSTVIGRNFDAPTGTGSQGRPGELTLAVETLVFFKNREITGYPDSVGIDGDTDIGFLAPIRFRFDPNERTAIELGGVLGQNFGDDNALDLAEPLLRIVYEPADRVYLVAGTIFPTHPIHDALLDDSRIFDQPAEQGFQVRIDRERIGQDLWINWRIRETDTRAEEFEVGSVTQGRLGGFHADGQMLWRHVGGQQNSTGRVENNIAGLLGGSWGTPIDRASITDLRGGAHGLMTYDSVDNETRGAIELFVQADARLRDDLLGTARLSHVFGDGLNALGGDPMYRFDTYTQAGVNAIFDAGDNLRLEAGVNAQFAEEELNYTFQVNIIWGGSFELGRRTP